MTAWRCSLALILLATRLVLADEPPGPPRRIVTADRVDVLAEPSEAAFVVARLYRGDTLEVVKRMADGWLAIRPPDGAFAWVDDTDVQIRRDGRVEVVAVTTVYLGREGVRGVGPPRTTVPKGTTFPAASQPILSEGRGRDRRIWRAVGLSGSDTILFARAEGVFDPSPPRPERQASAEGDPVPASLPPDLVGPFAEVTRSHRAAVDAPVERWDLSGVRRKYQALLTGRTDAASKAAIQDRIDEVDREAEMAKAAVEFEALVRRSRKRDAKAAQARDVVAELREIESLEYDAEGLLQGTGRRVDGEKVFSLLDDEGRIVAYLKIPAGIDTSNYLSRYVGVRGKSRFNDDLKFRLLDVRDLDALDSGR